MVQLSHVAAALAVVVVCASGCASTAREEAQSRDSTTNQALHRASTLLQAGDFRAAADVLEPLAQASPRDEQVFTMLGDSYRGLKDFEHAVSSYEQAMRLDYEDHLPHLKLGVLLMENRKTGRALTELEIAVKYGPDDALAHYNYGLALHELGRGADALAQWRMAADLDANDPRFAEAVGMGLAGRDDARAAESFARAARLGADSASFHNNYGLVLDRLGRSAEAEAHFRAALAASDTEEYRRNLALHELRAGHPDPAARELETLIAGHGERWSYAVYLARARVALQRYEAAIAALAPFAAEIDAGRVDPASPRIDHVPPTMGEALDVMGMAWRGRGDRARAAACLQRAVALEPNDVAHLNNYGVVLAESGKLPEARAQWRRVLEIDPANATAKANLAAFGP